MSRTTAMVIRTPVGRFEAEPHPQSEHAVILRSPDPGSLEALRTAILPDLEIDGREAVLATDEWEHALERLVG